MPSRAPREQAPAGAPVAWEYRTELIERGFMGFGNEQVDLETLQSLLDGLGADGWELVQMTTNAQGGLIAFFKRPLEG